MTGKSKKCTVIVRSRNSESVIGQALAALFSQEYRDFDLMVVDSGSTDRTLDIVAAYPHALVKVNATDYFPGRVLNDAAEKSSGDILVFLNSDCVPLTSHSLGRLVSALDDPDVHATFARQIPRPEARAWVRREYRTAFPESGAAPSWLPLSLPFAAMRRTAWQRHNFYTSAWGSEDTEWGHWAETNGVAVRYVPDSLVMHSHDYTPSQIYGRRFIEGEADAFIYDAKDTPVAMFRRVVGRIIRDWATDVRSGEWCDLPIAPIRRISGSWAYYRGNRLGNRRLRKGDRDGSLGQRKALQHHESRS